MTRPAKTLFSCVLLFTFKKIVCWYYDEFLTMDVVQVH
jgi:hypothetical protein